MELRVAQCLSDVGASRKPSIELAHQRQAERVVRGPEVGDDGAGASRNEGPDETGRAILAMNTARSRVAGRQRDERPR